MRCTFCKRESEETKLYEGVSESEMILVCKICSEREGIPLILKPSTEQINKANENYSVRERMERMSGVKDRTEISKEQLSVQKNLSKLKMPGRKQYHEGIVEDYYWRVNMARRRRKMTINQLSNKIGIDVDTIEMIEKGVIPGDFEEIFLKLESFLRIKLLKSRESKISFKRNSDEEKKILEEVRMKMERPLTEEEELIHEIEMKDKKKSLDRLSKGEIDFSKKEDLQNITLNDLIEMKRRREKQESIKRHKIQTDALLGDDIEIEDNL